MPQLDPAGEALRRRLAARSPDLFEPVARCTGTDSAGALTLTVDAARRVTGVKVHDVSVLRRPVSLKTALREAFAAADGERALASLRERAVADEWLERAERRLAGAPLEVRSAPDVSYAAYLDRGGRSRPERSSGSGAGPSGTTEDLAARDFVTADNGYLSIRRTREGLVGSVRVDEDWLVATTADRLEAAIDQAIRWPEEVPA